MVSLLALAAFALLLVYAACSDVASLKIPNWISLALAGLYAPLAFAAGAPAAEIGFHVAFGLAVLAVGFFLFQANIIGGGDAKLLAAASIWTGFAAFPTFLFWTAAAGGALALALLLARAYAPHGAPIPFVNRLLTPKTGVPYGVAIMAGGLAALPAIPLTASALTLP